MNVYLAKLHKLESLACSRSGRKGVLGEHSKPSKPSFEGFEGDHGKRFFETEPITTDIEIGMAMQFDMAANKKKTPRVAPLRVTVLDTIPTDDVGRPPSSRLGGPDPGQRGAGSMPLLRMRGAASDDDMNLTGAWAASRCFDTASTPTAKST